MLWRPGRRQIRTSLFSPLIRLLLRTLKISFGKEAVFKEVRGKKTIIPAPASLNYEVAGVTCAPSGPSCLLTVLSDGHYETFLYDFSNMTGRNISIPGLDWNGYFEADGSILFRRKDKDGTNLYKADSTLEAIKKVGPISKDETLIDLPIEGRPETFIRSGKYGVIYTRALGSAIESHNATFFLPEGYLSSSQGLLSGEWWTIDHPQLPDARALSLIKFSSASKDRNSPLLIKSTVVSAFATNAPAMPNYSQAAINGNDDVVVSFNGPGQRALGFLCGKQGEPGKGIRTFVQLHNDETASIITNRSTDSFIIAIHTLLRSDQFELVTLSPSSGGFAGRDCDSTTLTFQETGIPVEDTSSEFTSALNFATSADGNKVPYFLFAPKGQRIEHLIVDVYGAFALNRALPFYSDTTRRELVSSHTAIAFPIVRGDGDLGFQYAYASRTPNRDKAVADVLAVAAAAKADLPDLIAKPVVRGQSAGAWLAMRSVLARPSLFSGAIGFAGQYSFQATDNEQDHYRFFGHDDDLVSFIKSKNAPCQDLSFRFLHAVDDEKTSYADARSFADFLSSRGCRVDFETFKTGGHQIDITSANMNDASRKFHGYFDPTPTTVRH